MKNFMKTLVLLFLFFLLSAAILLFPKQALYFSLTGLKLWYDKMIPALLPFMILTNLLIEMGLTTYFVSFLRPNIGKLFRLSDNGIYAMLVGFLCGFPMGARTIARLYEKNLLQKSEASYLLSFCNNIGPVYFLSFVLVILKIERKLPFLIGMYGLPFCYGLILRYTKYRDIPYTHTHIHAAAPTYNILEYLDNSIINGLTGIAKLGGYMIFFNLLNLLPYTLFHNILPPDAVNTANLEGILNCILEITSGIGRLNGQLPLAVLILLPFGGLSCIAQTYSMIKETDLSIREYVCHKIILTAVSAVYYGLLLYA